MIAVRSSSTFSFLMIRILSSFMIFGKKRSLLELITRGYNNAY